MIHSGNIEKIFDIKTHFSKAVPSQRFLLVVAQWDGIYSLNSDSSLGKLKRQSLR